MSAITLSISEAARDLPEIIRRLFRRREHAVLTDAGKPVAEIVPVLPARIAKTGRELAALWGANPRLSSEEARGFADDIDAAKRTLGALKPPDWS